MQPGPTEGKDNYISGNGPTDQNNYGISTNIIVSGSASAPLRIMIEFDFDNVSSAAIIDNAKFQMYRFAGAGGLATLTVHKLNRTWSEGTGNGTEKTPRVDRCLLHCDRCDDQFRDLRAPRARVRDGWSSGRGVLLAGWRVGRRRTVEYGRARDGHAQGRK